MNITLLSCFFMLFNWIPIIVMLKFTMAMHPVYFKKTSAAPFGYMSPQLRGAWVCSWADLQNLQGGPAPPHQTETRWTGKKKFLCLSAPPVQAPHFGRLLCWMGVARYSQNYSGCMTILDIMAQMDFWPFWQWPQESLTWQNWISS